MWIRKGLRYVFMDQATDGSGGGGVGGAAGSDGGQGATGAGSEGGQGQGGAAASQAGADGNNPGGSAAGSAGAASAGNGTALESGAQGQQPHIPEKFQVKKEDGTLDIEASALKLAENYGILEKRLGSGDAPPKTADDYQIAVPDAFKEAFDPATDPTLAAFRKDAHAAGLNQKQFDFVLGEYFKMAPQLVGGAQQLSAEECTTELQKEWKTPEVYKAEVGKAFQAAQGFFGNDAEYIIKTYGNDPRLIRGLAKIGAEMGEDSPINPGPGSSSAAESIQSLQLSEAYRNPKHPDHARVSRQVNEFYAKEADKLAKSGALPVL